MNEYILTQYLRGQLLEHGIPDTKIQRIAKNLTTLKQPTKDEILKAIKGDHLKPKEVQKLWSEFLKTAHEFFAEYSTYYITAPQGRLIYPCLSALKENNYQLKHTLIWNKNNHVLGRSDYNYKHEPILYGWIHKHKHIGNGKHQTSVWDIDKRLKNKEHPTMKPVELVTNAILNSTKKQDTIFDPFLGSGTTLLACEQTNRTCHGIELEPKYCQVTINRWEQLTGQKAQKITVEKS